MSGPRFAPVDDDTADLLELLAEDRITQAAVLTDETTTDPEWELFVRALSKVTSTNHGRISPNDVRPLIAGQGPSASRRPVLLPRLPGGAAAPDPGLGDQQRHSRTQQRPTGPDLPRDRPHPAPHDRHEPGAHRVTTKKKTTDTTADDPGPVIRPFADFLREQSRGATHDELSETLHRLISRVRDTGKKGVLQLTITVAPLKGDADVLVVSDGIKVKLPEHDRKASMFYPDEHGNLSRTDPNQLTFEGLREVPPVGVDPTTGEIKELNA